MHTKAKIREITPVRVLEALDRGRIVLVAGFQGFSRDTMDITTLGRGGTDATAVALAAALEASCEIYSDVTGVFTADPRIVPGARKLAKVSYEEMLEMAACGAKVLALRCVEYARQYNVPVHVRSSFSQHEGTWIMDLPEGAQMEQAIISGIAHDRSEAKITVVGVPDKVGEAARIFQAVAEAEINIDLPKTDGQMAIKTLERIKTSVGFESLQYDDQIGKVSVVGVGMRSHPGVSAAFFTALASAGVNLEMISTSEIRISVVVEQDYVDAAVRAAHTAFGLDVTDGESAVVYGGTGR